MKSQTIQIGIDLGTTNSTIAINDKGKILVLKNVYQEEYTPSVFGFDRSGYKIVGKKAYEKLFYFLNEKSQECYVAEVKRLMGSTKKLNFSNVKVDLSSEEISSEILKNLKETLLKKFPDFPTACVVITVPAYFSIIESEATKRAGNLAGFEYVVLLQEPIAAAFAYGFDNNINENWLIYDLGGGTFDVAVISSKDNNLSVKSHNGNNFLGGKDFDKLIVENIIVPEIIAKYEFKDLLRTNPKYISLFARFKGLAEDAKKYLSQENQAEIIVEGFIDENNNDVFLIINLSRKKFEELIDSLITETIVLSKEAIRESGIVASSINRIILVGGPTQIPYIKERLEKELNINVDTSVDPLTVVAQGAAMYGAGQLIPSVFENISKEKINNILDLTLNYEPLSADTDQIITGTIEKFKEIDANYYIQIQSESGVYTSTKIKLIRGKFLVNVDLEERKSNIFWIYLFDEKANIIPITPDSFTITQGLTITGSPIAHTIGLCIAKKDIYQNTFKNTFEPIFEKNSILPLKTTQTYYTTSKLSKGNEENTLPIKILEGESSDPENNDFICDLYLSGKNIPYNLPEKTDVDITIEVNESREVVVLAYIPSIDQRFSVRSTIHDEELDTKTLKNNLNMLTDKFNRFDGVISESENKIIQDKFQIISKSLKDAENDEDSMRKANKDIKQLKQILKNLDKGNEFPKLVVEFYAFYDEVNRLANDLTDNAQKNKIKEQLKIVKIDANNAIDKEEFLPLVEAKNQISYVKQFILQINPFYWKDLYNNLINSHLTYSNRQDADYYISKGKKAIDVGDNAELERCVRSLYSLLIIENQRQTEIISGITKIK